ncbi:hypothetical protein P3W85_36825 [Cupriavidus basilensis]|uniref:Uncharacterized protein n=1 Tax=Cupriavidus basilensis TaxID=68895 RepID=A0ABT6B112_9BURK|nr:hypothetical protein [Cupriavidus basilensis]MDF3838458.1 hypothetical protein [Cupriavidus basilensis]
MAQQFQARNGVLNFSWEADKWIYTAVGVPLAGWVATAWLRWRRERAWQQAADNMERARRQKIDRLVRLPPECKTVLHGFHMKASHTRRLPPWDPAVRILVEEGILSEVSGGDTYDAVDLYFSVNIQLWAVLPDWLAVDSPKDAQK